MKGWHRWSIMTRLTPPLSAPLCCEGGRSRRGWRGGGGGFNLLLVSHCSSLLVIGTKLYSSPSVRPVLPVIVTREVIGSCPYCNPWPLFIVFSPFVPLRRGSKRQVRWSLAASTEGSDLYWYRYTKRSLLSPFNAAEGAQPVSLLYHNITSIL